MSCEVLLEHFCLASEVGALEHSVLTLGLVLIELAIGKHLSAAMLGVLTSGTNRAKLSLEQRVRVNEFKRS